MKREGAIVSDHPLPAVFTPELLVLDKGQGCHIIAVSNGHDHLILCFPGTIVVQLLLQRGDKRWTSRRVGKLSQSLCRRTTLW